MRWLIKKVQKTVFQCYAPEKKITGKKSLEKIETDFSGALEHWKDKIEEWILVHNDTGLTGEVVQLILRLQNANPKVKIQDWSDKELFDLVVDLPKHYIVDIFGDLATVQNFREIKIEDIAIVVDAIAKTQLDTDLNKVIVPSPLKLEKNELSADVRGLLLLGAPKTGIVERVP